MLIVGEDYGEGSSIMQERSHAFAMKSQVWLLDPRPNLPEDRRDGGEGVRAVGGLEHAGDAGGAHPRLPRHRALQDQGQRPALLHPEGRAGEPGPRREPHRAAARELPPREGEDREALAGGGQVRRGARPQRGLPGRGRRHRHRHAGRHVQHRRARAGAARPRRPVRPQPDPALRPQRHLPARSTPSSCASAPARRRS